METGMALLYSYSLICVIWVIIFIIEAFTLWDVLCDKAAKKAARKLWMPFVWPIIVLIAVPYYLYTYTRIFFVEIMFYKEK